jgi:hypothetical protein
LPLNFIPANYPSVLNNKFFVPNPCQQGTTSYFILTLVGQ